MRTKAQERRLAGLEQQRDDINGAEQHLDRVVWEGSLAEGDLVTRPPSTSSVLIARSLPTEGIAESHVFVIPEGRLFRFELGAWRRLFDVVDSSISDLAAD